MWCAVSSKVIQTNLEWRPPQPLKPLLRFGSGFHLGWNGVPFFIRAGKNLPAHATEVVVRFKRPPVTLFDEITDTSAIIFASGLAGYLRSALARVARLRVKKMRGEAVELTAVDDGTGDMAPYERLIGDAMAGDRQNSSPVRMRRSWLGRL